ncbi:MAG: YfcE family phosphodiesterase [Fuerstiella sp.]|nr:YfcE family phosphodiesterase [Fuerstiella sp.]
MKIGVIADIHDNVDNARHAVNLLNALQVDVVLIAGDFVSPLVVPSLRKLRGKVVACLGDNDGNEVGIAGGMKIVGTLAHGPVCFRTDDGLHILMAHQLTEIRDCIDGADVIVFAHSHRSSIAKDRHGRVFINPGEIGGWMYRKPSLAVLETTTREAEILELPQMPESVYVDG